jgi:hypothetical protein
LALDILDTLFGGSESKQKSVSEATSQPVDLTPSPFKRLQDPFGDTLRQLFGDAESPLSAAMQPGSSLSGPFAGLLERGTTETPEAQQLRDLLMADVQGGTGRQAYLGDVMAGNYLPGQVQANPFYSAFFGAAARPFTQEFERTVGRALPSTFLQAGHQVGQGEPSSAYDRARAIATEGYASSLSDLAARLGFQTYESERGRQQEAVGLSQADTDLMIKNYEAQLLPTFIAQFGIEQGLKEYQTRVAAALDILKTTAGVTQPTIAQQQKSKSTATATSESTGGIIPALKGTAFLPTFSGGV